MRIEAGRSAIVSAHAIPLFAEAASPIEACWQFHFLTHHVIPILPACVRLSTKCINFKNWFLLVVELGFVHSSS